MEVLLFFVLIYAAKHGWDDAWEAWRKSRSAYMTRADRNHPHMPKGKRAGHALRHDVGYGLSQLRHGFPQARHGFAAGWHQGRQAHAKALAERQKAKTEHLETRARLIPELREYRRRQKEALEQIRTGGAPPDPEEVPEREEGSEGSQDEPAGHGYCPYCGTRDDRQCPPACATWTLRGTQYPGREDGPAYSYGPEGSTSGWPSATSENAHDQARHMSGDGDPWVVTEYPPGYGGPGKTVARYVNGEEADISEGSAGEGEGSEGRQFEPVLLTGRSRSGRPMNPITGAPEDSAAVWDQEDLDRRLAAAAEDPDVDVSVRPLPRAGTSYTCDLCGLPLPAGATGVAHPRCLDAYERDNARWEVHDDHALEEVERDLRDRERCPWQIKPRGNDGGAIYCGQPIEDSGADEPDQFCPQHQHEHDGDDEAAAEELNERVRNLTQESGNQTTEGTTMAGTSGDTTYTQQLGELTAIRQDAEEEVNSVRRKRMMSRLDILSGLGLDSHSLSEAAAIDDALKEQERAAQETLEAADVAINGLQKRHGGIQEAVDSSPVDRPAEPAFYEN